jgi:glycerol-3-phosphate dehydrogenase
MKSFEEFVETELERKPRRLSEETTLHLIRTYGSEYRDVLRHCDDDPKWVQPISHDSLVIRAEILHGIQEEMACTVEDVLYRRTELGVLGYPDETCVRSCAEIIAQQLEPRAEPNRVDPGQLPQSY